MELWKKLRQDAAATGPLELPELVAAANRARIRSKGGRIFFCGIVNARSGRCSEDCAFCSQSVHHPTRAPVYDLISADKMEEAAARARKAGAMRFCLVTSGYALDEGSELETVLDGLGRIKSMGIKPCASLGVLGERVLSRLGEAGLVRYHHNLETAPSYFSRICTTHDFSEDVETVKNARAAGLETCCGGIFGMGESWEQRLELLYCIAELAPDSVPLNFLVPIRGTPLEDKSELTPVDCLKITALARLIMPGADIVLCGGREANMRDLQGSALFAGANGLMIGDYLTTPGREAWLDEQMVSDCGLRVQDA